MNRKSSKRGHRDRSCCVHSRCLSRHDSPCSLTIMRNERRKDMEGHRPRLKRLVGGMIIFSVCLGGTFIGSANTAFAYVPRTHRISMRRTRTLRRNDAPYSLPTVASSKIAPERSALTNSTDNSNKNSINNYNIQGIDHIDERVQEQSLHHNVNGLVSRDDFFLGDGISGMMSSRLLDDNYNYDRLLDDIDATNGATNGAGAINGKDYSDSDSDSEIVNGLNKVNQMGLAQNEMLSSEDDSNSVAETSVEVSIRKAEETIANGITQEDTVQKSKPRTSLFRRVRVLSRVKSLFRKSPSELDDSEDETDFESKGETSNNKRSLRQLWRKRNARTLEEGIRREQKNKLSVLMNKALINAKPNQEKSYVERSLMGLLNGLAEEVEDLDIELNTISKTPFWRKEVEEIRINFSRLGFRPIQIGGTNSVVEIETDNVDVVTSSSTNTDEEIVMAPNIADSNRDEQEEGNKDSLPSIIDCADEGFDRIDEDGSGTVDKDELAQALNSIAGLKTNEDTIKELASDLVRLYDDNGDGVVDREEYKRMVEDMAKLRASKEGVNQKNPFAAMKDSIQSVSEGISNRAGEVVSAARDKYFSGKHEEEEQETEMGSIVLSNVNLDLRRLVFGAFPVIKKITPGGPLILEPFTATVKASFSREDVMGSFLLDAALRRLVARALRVRVRSYRDLVEGAVFVGRQWKMESKAAPVVEVLGLSNVEFDSGDKMIVTGRAKIRADPDAPIVTSTFKLRTKIGTRKNGQVIKLKEPELAFVLECPKALERGLGALCKTIGLPPPKRPEPYYSFFPIYSPFKVDDDSGGFDMGEDNCIRSIYIRNGKLRFEMSVVLRPGRFLGNHYLAFTVPQRTFIITMDRVWNGIRAARENKQVADRAKKLKKAEEAAEEKVSEPTDDSPEEDSVSEDITATPSNSTSRWRFFKAIKDNTPKPKSFYTRFLEGYTMLDREKEANNERISNVISDWFGRQGSSDETSSSGTDNPDEERK
mmetsp:Transcript_25061/g.59141  ORF Transcript_25061/g.59141 Transcript_25061/m.59141 type:complete len:991 (+) Transcript_25061:84-3056(+)